MAGKYDTVHLFESRVRKGLSAAGVDLSRRMAVGVAVSGGADSVALLTALCHIVPENVTVRAVTVNHNIRPAAETEGDAAFVQEYCMTLGVPCDRHDLPRGAVEGLAKRRGQGMEDAARSARYAVFATFIAAHRLACLCLAHTKNDQLETVLMRFLSGGDVGALGGIPPVRGAYVRPLLGVSRMDIEAYLGVQGIPFRTDQTNFDSRFFRNCIRNHIMPMLDRETPGWQSAMESLVQKMRDDDALLTSLTEAALVRLDWRAEDSGAAVSLDAAAFAAEPAAVQRRVLYRAVAAVGADSRVPYTLVSRACRNVRERAGTWREAAAGIEVLAERGRLLVRHEPPAAGESGFFAIVEHAGSLQVAGWTLSAHPQGADMLLRAVGESGSQEVLVPGLGFPFAFRSRQPADMVCGADGSFRAVARVLDDWKCGSLRDSVPVVQELRTLERRVRCIWGALLGFDDWVVRETE